MSKLAKKPVVIKEGVNIAIEDNVIKVSGSKGTLSFAFPKGGDVRVVEGNILVSLKDKNGANLKPLLGLTRAMISNMVKGVSEGFEEKLELSGVGYRAQVTGSDLNLSVGFSHPVKITAKDGLSFSVFENIITVSGIDKDKVGNLAANIRKIRPPEPYKGKGIKYQGERIRRKAGKAAKALGAK